MIDKLLEYQEHNKRRIEISAAVEGGRTKREILAANKMLNDAKATLLELETAAANLQAAFENTKRNLVDLMASVKSIEGQKVGGSEVEMHDVAVTANTLLQKVNAAENQLRNIGANVEAKVKSFEDTKNMVVRAQTVIKTLTPQYDEQLAKIKPQLDAIDKELARLTPLIDKNLLEKYKARRRSEPARATDIVVPIRANRCGACHFEMPLSSVNKIAVDGYVVCEECGKIIYKGH